MLHSSFRKEVSLTKTFNNYGPRIEPWGTPFLSHSSHFVRAKFHPLMSIIKVIVNGLTRSYTNPHADNLANSRSWGKLSKALLR